MVFFGRFCTLYIVTKPLRSVILDPKSTLKPPSEDPLEACLETLGFQSVYDPFQDPEITPKPRFFTKITQNHDFSRKSPKNPDFTSKSPKITKKPESGCRS